MRKKGMAMRRILALLAVVTVLAVTPVATAADNYYGSLPSGAVFVWPAYPVVPVPVWPTKPVPADPGQTIGASLPRTRC